MDDEYEEWANSAMRALADAGRRERIAVACRGSANPAALAWIAEGLELGRHSVVVDLGAGLGGPAAWVADRYGCAVLACEPERAMAQGALELFGLTVVEAGADRPPVGVGAVDAAMLLGVLSVVDEPVGVLRRASESAAALGVLDYCATGGATVHAGGSSFPTPDELDGWLADAGWAVDVATDVEVESPPSWQRAIDEFSPPDRSDAAADVADAVAAREIRPRMLVARRAR